jgi:replicative DNA helicase
MGSAEIIIAKHRNGPTGAAQLAFIARSTKFANMAVS